MNLYALVESYNAGQYVNLIGVYSSEESALDNLKKWALSKEREIVEITGYDGFNYTVSGESYLTFKISSAVLDKEL